jgi:hypothetical protein
MSTPLSDPFSDNGAIARTYGLDRELGHCVEFTPENQARVRGYYPGFEWVAYRYSEQLELARQTRNALLAVQAELFRLHFQAWGKKTSFVFGNTKLRSLGFSHHEKIRALKVLEAAGWISVQWRKGRSPLVTIVKGFRLGR